LRSVRLAKVSGIMGRITHDPEETMKLPQFRSLPSDQEGKAGYILLWLLGVPIPVLFLFFLLRGCT
jgi:hypothetical protein